MRRIAVSESVLPITEEFLTIIADRLASHLKVRIEEMVTSCLSAAGTGTA